jgi:hypothetical protein|tara:strand:- start:591 stop:776 length:186 start_codon:yes stop_codon:yes gene_type:complete
MNEKKFKLETEKLNKIIALLRAERNKNLIKVNYVIESLKKLEITDQNIKSKIKNILENLQN